jgi:hypothetical protein
LPSFALIRFNRFCCGLFVIASQCASRLPAHGTTCTIATLALCLTDVAEQLNRIGLASLHIVEPHVKVIAKEASDVIAIY